MRGRGIHKPSEEKDQNFDNTSYLFDFVNIRWINIFARKKGKMASFIIKVLSVTLGLFFIFVGLLKLSPVINKELYKEMVCQEAYLRAYLG